jgi:hypothetical protein
MRGSRLALRMEMTMPVLDLRGMECMCVGDADEDEGEEGSARMGHCSGRAVSARVLYGRNRCWW